MAVEAKHSHIRLDESIWDDPVIVTLTPQAFKAWVFGIAWSKHQCGRVPDGLLTPHGLTRVGATPEIVSELLKAHLLAAAPNGCYEIVKYSDWQITSTEVAKQQEYIERARDFGRQGAAKRWQKPTDLPPLEDGFDVDEAFKIAWDAWPPQLDFREKRSDAYEAFRASITSKSLFDQFGQALQARVRAFKSDKRPLKERRQYLGAFKNFCDPERWESWLPKGSEHEPVTIASAPATGTAPGPPADWKPWEPEF